MLPLLPPFPSPPPRVKIASINRAAAFAVSSGHFPLQD